MKQKNQKRNRGGFTLAETLIAVLILTMVAGIVAGGIPAARNALDKAVDVSHSQLLLSTTMTSLRNELATARSITCASEPNGENGSAAEDPEVVAARKIIYYVDSSGAVCTLHGRWDLRGKGCVSGHFLRREPPRSPKTIGFRAGGNKESLRRLYQRKL